ncbi:hypothetical protein [Marinicella rhabdoformis]|uniref:hypothetical protein n=1 Tax=Marinicella rhabdoformis TaxID=2580566 RepID=UPI0012AEB575|nr:hypothetical protein [Marinicella rhabdoformis]
MKKNSTILFLLLPVLMLLSACAPKYQYVNPVTSEASIDRIYVVMDYVEFVDDVGKLYNYDLPLNREKLAGLQETLSLVLNQKGYEAVYFVSKSSGYLLNADFDFELYHNKKNQKQLISPPFLIESQFISAEEQDALLNTLSQFQGHGMVSVKEDNMGYLNRLQMMPVALEHELSDTAQWSAVLFVQVTRPRVSFGKGFGMALMSTAISVGASGGSVYTTITPYGVAVSNSLLFDMQSGQLLWKNYHQSSVEAMQTQSLKNYFKHFPVVGN